MRKMRKAIRLHDTPQVSIQKEAFDKMLEFDIRGKRILEIGCGNGYWTNILKKDNIVVPTDIRDYGLDGFVYANAENLPFKGREFDVVFGGDVLHHVDLFQAVNEIKRVLKPDGHYYGVEPNGYWWYFWTIFFQFGHRFDNERPIFPQEIIKAFKVNGLKARIKFSMERLPLLRIKSKSKYASYMIIKAVKL